MREGRSSSPRYLATCEFSFGFIWILKQMIWEEELEEEEQEEEEQEEAEEVEGGGGGIS